MRIISILIVVTKLTFILNVLEMLYYLKLYLLSHKESSMLHILNLVIHAHYQYLNRGN
jgi:hypothetical protein